MFGKPRLIAIWLAAAVTLLAFIGGTAAAFSAAVYKSQIFNPAFSVVLQPGWTVAERDVAAAQIYKKCADCVHQGEEERRGDAGYGVLRLDAEVRDQATAWYAGARSGACKQLFDRHAARLGVHGAARQSPDRLSQESGFRTDPSGSPLQIIAVRARGKTVTIFIDPHEATPAQTPRFMKNAAALLRGLRFR